MNNLFRGLGQDSPDRTWNILTIVVLVLTACIVGYFAIIFVDPTSFLNPLQPGGGGLFVPAPPTQTPPPIKLEPTWTPSPLPDWTPSNTPRPTFTPFFTDTPFSLVPPTRTPKPTSTPKAPFSATSVKAVDSTLIHPDLACNWAGIGGTVDDESSSPVIGMVVVLRGFLDGKSVDLTTVTGINKEYGPSGYEFVLGDAPISSNKTLYVQLVDQSGIPLSDKIEVTTYDDCSKNLILVRFKKNR